MYTEKEMIEAVNNATLDAVANYRDSVMNRHTEAVIAKMEAETEMLRESCRQLRLQNDKPEPMPGKSSRGITVGVDK